MRKSILMALAIILSFAIMEVPSPVIISAEQDVYTVYVNAETGSDSNSGDLTTPVATISEAYTKLGVKMLTAAPGSEGKIVISGTVEYSNAAFPTFNSWRVTLTGALPEDGIRFTCGAIMRINGDTTFKDITLTHNGTNSSYRLNLTANGYNVIIDEGVTSVPKISNAGNSFYITLVGGCYSNNLTANANLTVKSGTWREIIAGSGSADRTLTGNATLTMTGGTIISESLTTGYFLATLGTVTGNITVNIGGTASIPRQIADVNSSSISYGSCTFNLTGGSISSNGGRITSAILKNSQAGGAFTTNINLSGGGNLYLEPAAATVDNFVGGGMLTLAPGAALTVTSSVSGTTKLYIDGPPKLKTYITTPLGTSSEAFSFVDVLGVPGAALAPVESNGKLDWNMKGYTTVVTFVNPYASEGFRVTGVYSGYKVDANKIIQAESDGTYILGAGVYCYRVSGPSTSRQPAYKLFLVDMDDIRAKTLTMTLPDTGPYNNSGAAGILNDEALDALYSTDNLVHYKDVLNSNGNLPPPAFNNPTRVYQRGTYNEEIYTFLNDLAAKTENMYVFWLQKSTLYDQDIPLVVFTKERFDYTDGTTWKELQNAATAFSASGKPSLGCQAQIHGGAERSPGEGALTMINELAGEYGDNILDDVNVYVIPRLNTDGDVSGGGYIFNGSDRPLKNPNRDNTILELGEMKFVHKVFFMFMPEMYIDLHESQGAVINEAEEVFSFSPDMTFQIVPPQFSLDDEELAAETEKLAKYLHSSFVDEGMRAKFFADSSSRRGAINYTMSHPYTALRGGCYSIIFEGNKNTNWTTGDMKRRTYSQYFGVKIALDYLAKNADDVTAAVQTERDYWKNRGKTYDETNVVDLKSSFERNTEYMISLENYVYDLYGNVVSRSDAINYIVKSTVLRSRPLPTAYVIPKGESWTEEAMAILRDGHEFYYIELPNGTELNLQQYYITKDDGTAAALEAGLKPEATVRFDNGAYLFPMAQTGSYILAGILEPDVTHVEDAPGTFVQAGVIPIETDKTVSLYRYTGNDPANTFADGSNYAVYSLIDEGDGTVTAKIRNNNGVGDAKVIISFFGVDNRLLEVAVHDISVGTGDTDSYFADIPAGCISAKCFVWNSLRLMNPLAKSNQIPINQ